MSKKKFLFIYILMPVSVFVVFLFSLTIDLDGISFISAVEALFGGADENVTVIIKQIRFPRIFMACIVGAGLAVSGCVFQSILKNPLADPFTLGISSGASLGAATAFISGLAAVRSFFIPFCAFAGMIVSVSIVYLLSMQKRFTSNAMILSGVVVSYIFSSAVMLIFALSTENSVQAAFLWLMGNFSAFDERLLPFITIVVLISTTILSLSGNVINAVSLGGEKPKTFGMNIERNIKFLFLTASFITAATVSICGVIGFVGLMIPHIMRKIIGTNNVVLIPSSAFAGAVFLPLCDTLSRMLFSPVLIPVSVITSIIGGLFFICLLLRPDKK
jgi:iron complex transport system permease protein